MAVYVYQNIQLIAVQPVPNQTLSVTLDNQIVVLNIYQRGGVDGILFMDVFLAGELIIAGRVCQNGNKIIRNSYFGFEGDLVFWDMQGTSDPQFTGLGSRWVLAYYS